MKKYYQYISTVTLALIIILGASGFIFPSRAQAQPLNCPEGQIVEVNEETGVPSCVTVTVPPPSPGVISKILGFGTDILLAPLSWMTTLMLQLASLITYLSGTILNYVVQFTIVDMKTNLEKANAINDAWRVIRDVANMGFIFVLLYAAIQTILGIGSDAKKLIVNIVIVAILINFSLFFTKVVIDASNVLSIMFYDAIAPGALNQGLSLGLSGKLMQNLHITSLWDIKGLELLYKGKTMIIIGVMGTIVSLIAAFIFFAIAIILVIRFVVLIFVLILSPLAFIAVVLPALKPQATKWKDALIGQAFFAPIYFMLTWIVVTVSSGLLGNTAGDMATVFGGVSVDGRTVVKPPIESIGLLVNFIIMIALLIASLVISKDWANKAGPIAAGATKWAMGAAGGATLGMAGRFGRGTLGRAGAAIGDNEWLKERAAKGGLASRLTLAAGRKTSGASFDLRGTPVGNQLDAGKAQKGGFAEFRKKKAESEVKFATSLAPSAKAIAKNPALLGNKAEIDKRVGEIEKTKQREVSNLRSSEELKSAEVREKSAYDAVSRLEAEAGAAVDATKADKIRELETAKVKLEEIKKEASEARKKVREETERITTNYDAEKETLRATAQVDATADTRKKKFAEAVEKSVWARGRGYNYDAAAQIRKGKSKKDKLTEAAADFAKEIAEEEAPETPTPTAPTPPPAPPTPPTP